MIALTTGTGPGSRIPEVSRIPKVKYVEMFVSVRGGPYLSPGFQGLIDG